MSDNTGMTDPNACDQEVFTRGVSLGLYVMSKEAAETLCSTLTAKTGFRYDWHYVAGRVHIKTLDPCPKKSPTNKESSC
jgi:hypothetical protein